MKHLFIPVLLALLVSCHLDNNKKTSPAASTPLPAESTQSGDSLINVRAGDEFVIQLRGSLGSGFSWLLQDSLDKNYLQLVNATTKTDSVETAVRPDLQIFRFKALKQGTTSISMLYKRPWKKEEEKENERKKYAVTITP